MLKTLFDILSRKISSEYFLNDSCSMILELVFQRLIILVFCFSFVFENRFSRMIGVETQSLFSFWNIDNIASFAFAFRFRLFGV